MLELHIIGIPDSTPTFSPEIRNLMAGASQFAGGKRHLELVVAELPPEAQIHPIEAPVDGLIQKIRNLKGKWIILASGDPLFYGIGNTLVKAFPEAQTRIYPYFNSLQLLGHRFRLEYGKFLTISLTGRSMDAFHTALIRGVHGMGILTDRKHTPAMLAGHMKEYGYDNYRMYYGECLGGEREKIMELTLDEALELVPRYPNCFFLEKTDERISRRGIPEDEFVHLEGRPKMITKLPIRLSTLSLMQLENRKVFWDIGACTGSVSIEARLQYPHLKVSTFERREESRNLLLHNARKFQAPGIIFHNGDFLQISKENLERPDAVFLGGYGGEMEAILDEVDRYLHSDGVLAFNSVSEDSLDSFVYWCEKKHYAADRKLKLKVDQHNLITILTAIKPDA